MARNIERLPANFVDKDPKPGTYHDGGGLYLFVSDSGAVHYKLRYTIGGKRRALGLGSNRTHTLIEAREKARLARRQVDDDTDPKLAKEKERRAIAREQAKNVTVAQASNEYIEALTKKVAKNLAAANTLKQRKNYTKKYFIPYLGDVPVAEMTGQQARAMLQPIAEVTPATAAQVEAHGKALFKREQKNERFPPEKLNPFSRRGAVGMMWEEIDVEPAKHYAGLPAEEIPAFMQRLLKPKTGGSALLIAEAAEATGQNKSEIVRAIHRGELRARQGPYTGVIRPRKTAWFIEPDDLFKWRPYKGDPLERPKIATRALALAFYVLMACRPEMVLGMLRDEYDPRERIWTVPWWKHKAGRITRQPLILPVSSPATDILQQAWDFQDGPFGAKSHHFFANGRASTAGTKGSWDGKPLRIGALQEAFNATIEQPGYYLYGFRSSFSTWAYEQGRKYQRDAIEMSLGHTRRTIVDERGVRCTDRVRMAYDHAQLIPDRRRLMEDWANLITGPATSPASKVVIPFAEVNTYACS
jgi:integrase